MLATLLFVLNMFSIEILIMIPKTILIVFVFVFFFFLFFFFTVFIVLPCTMEKLVAIGYRIGLLFMSKIIVMDFQSHF